MLRDWSTADCERQDPNGTVVPRPGENPKLVRDCSMLLAAKDTLAGDGSLDWSADLLMSSWKGVRMGSLPSLYLRELRLTGLGLTGSIPAALGGLDDLRRLDLDENELTGEIPSEMGRLSKLEQLYLQGNSLRGNIPTELGTLTNLRTLDLRGNDITGCIPAGLANNSNLRVIATDGLEPCR